MFECWCCWQCYDLVGKYQGKMFPSTGIFQRDLLSPLPFVSCNDPRTLILRKNEPVYISGSKIKINHLLFMDNQQLCLKKRQPPGITRTINIFMQQWYWYEIWYRECVLRQNNSHSERISVPDETRIRLMKEGEW